MTAEYAKYAEQLKAKEYFNLQNSQSFACSAYSAV